MSFMSTGALVSAALKSLKPPPNITVSEWADKFRRLSPESSASPGRWRTSTTEYLREPMDMVGKPGVRRITLMTSAQVGKSSYIENVLGFLMHYDPCPILHVSPTIDSMKMFSKERLAPMIRDTPVLRNVVKDARSRDSGNTLAGKKFTGGNLAMVGANAPAGLASRPVRVVVADEVDRFERSAGTEGDPLTLAVKRTTTFWNRVLIFVSTPGNKIDSRIEEEFERGDQRYRWCKCHDPDCGEWQILRWANVKWSPGEPDTAAYMCDHCGVVWDDQQRNKAVREGEWRASKPFNGNVSYHLNQLYSPFAPLSDGVRDFLDAKKNPELLKTWVNTFLGETWEEKGKRLEWSDVMDLREEYETEPLPEDVTLVTGAVDVQDDRLEAEFVGWGDDHRSWSLGYHVIYGDLSTKQPWDDLTSLLKQPFVHPMFGELVPRMTCIDSGGHYTQSVYAYVAQTARTTAIKGVGGAGKPIVGRPSKNTLGGSRVFPLGVDTIKEVVVARLNAGADEVGEDQAGRCRFPMSYGEEYFRGLTAETLMTTFRKGFKRQEWVKVRARNEPFDLRVYNTAALEMLSVDLNAQRRAELRKAELRVNSKTSKPKPRREQPVGGNWVDGWKSD